MNIRNDIQNIESEIIKIRRDLHKIPEIGFHEYKTKEYIKSYLEKLEPNTIEVGLGVKAVFWNNCKNTIAFRADIDALPIEEKTGLPFASEHKGCMHACGHDGHTAILLGFAKYVSERRTSLKSNIVLIFQPCEEAEGGAVPIIENGILENPTVDEIYGLHIWPEFKKHKLIITPGPLMSGMDDFFITFKGKASHGALPHMGNDAIVAAASFIMNSQTIISRNISPFDQAVFTIGTICGGSAVNIVADEVIVGCTLRAFTEENLILVKKRILDSLKGIESTFGVSTEIKQKSARLPVINDEELAERAIGKIESDSLMKDTKVMPSEDFSYYQKEIKGLFVLLGSRDDNHEKPLHSAEYLLNEEILVDGIELFARIAEIDD